MLEEIYRCKSTIELLRKGPLGGYPDELAQYYFNRGYTAKHMKPRFGPLSQFNKSLINSNKSAQDLVRKLIDEFINLQLETKKCFINSGANLRFKQFIKRLVRDGIGQPLANKPGFGNADIKGLLSEYKLYLSREKGLASSSVDRLSNLARAAIVYLNTSTIPKLRNIKAENIHTYIIASGKI